jgi:hypothetical protein
MSTQAMPISGAEPAAASAFNTAFIRVGRSQGALIRCRRDEPVRSHPMTVRDVLDFQELMFCACVRNAMTFATLPSIWRRK